MSRSMLKLTDSVYDYMLEHSLRESEACRRLREETAPMKMGMMQVSPEQGQFMGFLVQLTGARRALEVGTFTGYSALWVAQALPSDGQLVCCDVSEEWTSVGRRHWQAGGVNDRIDLKIGPAVDTLQALREDGEEGTYDFAFIDADKENYLIYYESVLSLLRTGGLLLIDNVLWGGSVASLGKNDDDTNAIRALNRHLHRDDRVTLSMLPVGDGLTLVMKKQP
ncbi:MAG TPA: SAM-dependent methyltransferase [Gammaproteobacteria bacterium]|nr:class I SAM-dependent methyltransferase [Arenicellales bacterium]HCF73733.1 SAM-dependent methyltransferase [Gammaproteobacteria bacterium]